jgi:hypothetical protein
MIDSARHRTVHRVDLAGERITASRAERTRLPDVSR